MLSVVVPVYNVEEYLPKCIESILNQTYNQLEVILVDDGSIDNCSQICDTFAERDTRIKVIHQENLGLVVARKAGLNIAKGEYITFVDGDDWIEQDMYLKLIKTIEQVNADFVDSGHFCNIGEFSRIDRKLERNIYKLDDYTRYKAFLSLLNLDDFIKINQNIWCKVFKDSIIKEAYAKVPDAMQYGEDVIAIVHCILKASKVAQVEEVFYHYRYREDSLSHLKSVSLIRKELSVWNYCGNIMLKNNRFITQNEIDCFLFRRMYTSFNYLMVHEFDVIQYYAFPQIEMLFEKEVVIYGAGNVGKDYITQISKYERCKIVCWADKQYRELHFKYREVVSVEHFLKKTFDIVLIAVEKKELAYEIKKSLIKKGVPGEKILWCEPKVLF